MSLKTKNTLKKCGKICGAILFAIVFFLNIKIMSTEKSLFENGDISLFGVEFTLFQATHASGGNDYKMSAGTGCADGCEGSGDYWVSCHLPGSECDIFGCQCFQYPH